jgi:glycosyltransferase involved in cell wall biosynthesis
MSTSNNLPNVCIVSSYGFTDTNATKARIGAYIDVLSNHFNVSLIAPFGDSSTGMTEVKLVVLSQAPVGSGFLIRAIREFFYSFKILRKLYQLQPDVVVVSCPSMFLLLLVNYKFCPTILDIRDLTWEYLPNSTLFYRVIKFVFRVFASKAIRNADMIWVTNNREYSYVNKLIGFQSVSIPVRIVRNGISSKRFEAIREIEDKRDSTYPLLLYIGNIGIAQNLTTIVEVAEQFPNIRILIVGDGRDLERVRKFSDKRQANNITFIDGVPWENLKKYYSKASILYAQITPGYDSAIPSKLYEYLTVGVPIIYGGQGEAVDFLAEFDDVQVVEPENSRALSQAISNILIRIMRPKNIRNPEIIRKKYQRENQVSNLPKLVFEIYRKGYR